MLEFVFDDPDSGFQIAHDLPHLATESLAFSQFLNGRTQQLAPPD